jgi:hypothetical protein
MGKALTPKRNTKTEVAKAEREQLVEDAKQVVGQLFASSQVDAVHALAAQFKAEDGAGQALSLVTAAVAVSATECVRRATSSPYLEQRELELSSLNTLARTTAKLTQAWDAHANRDKKEVNIRDVNVAPGAQAVVGVVGLSDSAPKPKNVRKRLKPSNDEPQA